MKGWQSVLVGLVGVGFVRCVPSFAFPAAQVTARVVDEQRRPIAGAEVEFSFEISDGQFAGSSTTVSKKCVTGPSGCCTGTGEGVVGAGAHASKEGVFYSGGEGFAFKYRSFLNRWEPWNPTLEVMLKRKRKPVPMYACSTGNIRIPVFDTPIGFDLEVRDWVFPHGKGVRSDLLFTYHTNYRAYGDYKTEMQVSFVNEFDGIQEYVSSNLDHSEYKWPFEAPLSGYNRLLKKEKSAIPSERSRWTTKENVNYIFRVRTSVAKDGRILAARYGKMNSEIDFDPYGTISFSYAFNPDGTRNLEFDPKRNLFRWESQQDEEAHRWIGP